MDDEYCQKTVITGLGGVGKTQIALEAVYRIRKMDPECSIFWVPAVDSTSCEQAYRDIGKKLQVIGVEKDDADVKSLVKAALSQDGIGRWLMVVDSADDVELMFGEKGAEESESGPSLARYLPFCPKGSFLFTTRNSRIAVDLSGNNLINVGLMDTWEANELLGTSLTQKQKMVDVQSTTRLLHLFDQPAPCHQASISVYEPESDID